MRLAVLDYSKESDMIATIDQFETKLPEIEAVHPNLTLEGLRIVANRNIGPISHR